MFRLVPILLCASASAAAGTAQEAQAHLGKGSQLMQDERYAEAADEFQKALASDPALGRARRQLAVCQFELRDYDHARPLFERMISIREDAAFADYYLGRMDLLDRKYDSAIRRLRSIPRESPVRDELYYLGSAYYKLEKYREAAEILKQASEENPRDARVHQLLARAYQKLGEREKSESEFAETKRLHNYYLEGSVVIGRCRSLLARGQTEAAWDLCAPLTVADDVDKIAAVGMLFGEAEKYTQALTAWEKAVALDPDSSEIQYNLALTCFRLHDVLRARACAAEAVRLRPDFVEANILYGTILYMGAEDREAIAVLTRANELKPDDLSVRRLLAEELVLSAERDVHDRELGKAAELLEKASALRPDSQQIAARLAEVRAMLGNTH